MLIARGEKRTTWREIGEKRTKIRTTWGEIRTTWREILIVLKELTIN